MRLIPLALAALVLAAAPAAAQRLAASAAPAASAEAFSPPSPRIKSGSRARLLALHSVVATGVGAALLSQGVESQWKGDVGYWLFAYGTVAAPSAGNLYAGDRERAMRGMAIRGAGGALVVTSMIGHVLSTDIDDPDAPSYDWDSLNLAGGAIILAGAAYSIATAGTSVAEHNERMRGNPPLAAAPTIHAGRDGVGLGVRVRF